MKAQYFSVIGNFPNIIADPNKDSNQVHSVTGLAMALIGRLNLDFQMT